MQRLFSSSIAQFALTFGCLTLPTSAGADRIVQIPSERDFAAMVFVGSDNQMPLASGQYYISIEPTRERDGTIAAPSDVRGVMMELMRALPHWYINVLTRSSGDADCTVTVGQSGKYSVDYGALVQDWYWINWHLQDSSSALRLNLGALGLKSRDQILWAIRAGFCNYAKTGNLDSAIQLVGRYGQQ